MAVRSTKNQYRGINAHLHSYWQSRGGWSEFHTSYIVHLSDALKGQLLPLGYTTGIEQSLQIRRADTSGPIEKPISDVTIYDTNPSRAQQPFHGSVSAPLVAPILELDEEMEEIAEYRALAVYKQGDTERKTPVAWIELLSPSNKPGGQDDRVYTNKRRKLMHSGIVFIEVDFLNESPPTFSKLPAFLTNVLEPQSSIGLSAYRILVVDPRPTYYEGQIYIYSIGVDEPIPLIKIPLSSTDVVEADFAQPYQRTLEAGFFARELVDYSQLPVNFERYSADDQARIVNRMLSLLKAVEQGKDLETSAPLPVEALSLEQALTQFRTIAGG